MLAKHIQKFSFSIPRLTYWPLFWVHRGLFADENHGNMWDMDLSSYRNVCYMTSVTVDVAFMNLVYSWNLVRDSRTPVGSSGGLRQTYEAQVPRKCVVFRDTMTHLFKKKKAFKTFLQCPTCVISVINVISPLLFVWQHYKKNLFYMHRTLLSAGAY